METGNGVMATVTGSTYIGADDNSSRNCGVFGHAQLEETDSEQFQQQPEMTL